MKFLPIKSLNLDALDQQLLYPGTKGLPLSAPLCQADVGKQGWNVLAGDVSFPVALLKNSAIQHNLQWMKQFCERSNVVLAPHGKTTMSPQLFDAQISNGAWGMTLATVTQTQIAHRYGVRRVLLANQLVSRSDIRVALDLLQQDATFEFYCLADSEASARRLSDAVREHGLNRALPVLVELGFAGGRTGCRSTVAALQLGRYIAHDRNLQLAGVEGYEGLLVTNDRAKDLIAVQSFVADLLELTQQADRESLFQGEQIILSAGGSAYFDLVGRGFADQGKLSRPLLNLLRSGCYVTHDHGFYHGLLAEMQNRETQLPTAGLRPALEVWSMVQSRPSSDLAILTMGKRDASYDIDLPIPLQWHRPGQDSLPQAMPEACSIFKMNDQHAYLRLPPNSTLGTELAVGDIVACGISHPCTTFDKWSVLLVVNDQYDVEFAINTFF